jgi:hypothetical protein
MQGLTLPVTCLDVYHNVAVVIARRRHILVGLALRDTGSGPDERIPLIFLDGATCTGAAERAAGMAGDPIIGDVNIHDAAPR